MKEMDRYHWTKKSIKEAQELRLLAESPDDFANRIQAWILKHHNVLMTISFQSLRFNMSCSNTHVAPVGGMRNWSCQKNIPHGYPGLIGRLFMIKSIQTGDYCGTLVDTWDHKVVGLNTGTGGGGYNSKYDVTLFCSDFPKFGQKYIDEYTFEKLLSL